MTEKTKILIIRFSAFGDVVQTLSVASALKSKFPNAEIHWATRKDMLVLLQNHPAISKVWSFERKSGLSGLFNLGFKLRRQKFTHIYDVHNNLRSRVLCRMLRPLGPLSKTLFIRRSIYRWKRFLLFNFRINKFEMPFSGQRDLLAPLEAWGISRTLPPTPQMFLNEQDKAKALEILGNETDWIALGPSASYELKRWPIEHWKSLILAEKDKKFVLLGGPEDLFIEEIAQVAPERVKNLAGKISLSVSAGVVAQSKAIVSNDTWLLHAAEQMGRPAIALMGPAPFGYPSRPMTTILEKDLSCKPCSKHGQGPCVNKQKFHECMVDITPSQVARNLDQLIQH